MNKIPTIASQVNMRELLQQGRLRKDDFQSGVAYLTFGGKSGEYTYGRDKEDVEGEELFFSPAHLKHGWILWHNRVAQKRMAPFTQELPEPMPAIGKDEPNEARSATFFFPDDLKTPVVFDTNTLGGRRAIDGLMAAVEQQVIVKGSSYSYPKVRLEKEDYMGSKGQVYNPIFEIVGWYDENLNEEPPEATALTSGEEPAQAAEPAQAEPPKRKRRKAAS